VGKNGIKRLKLPADIKQKRNRSIEKKE